MLFEHLFKRRYRWSIPNDDNRAEDARELRISFLDHFEIRDDDRYWMDLDSSVLEVLMALSQRAAFETEEAPEFWFWKFMENLNLTVYTDDYYQQDNWGNVDEIINKLLDRKYTRRGQGGLFPLQRAKEDQRKVEIWYQMSAYLLENRYVT